MQRRVIHLVHHTSANGLPLGADRDERQFKSLFLDVGLLNRLCGLDLVGTGELITLNEGALAEQSINARGGTNRMASEAAVAVLSG